LIVVGTGTTPKAPSPRSPGERISTLRPPAFPAASQLCVLATPGGPRNRRGRPQRFRLMGVKRAAWRILALFVMGFSVECGEVKVK
jgi:hypothetical protein